MRTIKTNFKRSGRYFILSMAHLFEALIGSVILVASVVYNGMNGRFSRVRLKKPYVYVWRAITWSVFIWVTFTYVFVPFFSWWERIVAFLNYVIWG